MEIKRVLNTVEIFIASIIAVLTIMVTMALYSKYLLSGEPLFTKYAVDSLFFILVNVKITFLITTMGSLLLGIVTVVHYVHRADTTPSKTGSFSKVPVAQGFLFIFLMLSLLSSITPPVPHIDRLVGIYGLAAYYEQVVIITSLLLIILSLFFVPLIHSNSSSIFSSFIDGDREQDLFKYAYTLVPAAIAAFFFYIFYGFTGYEFLFFFLIFTILFIFAKRYGILLSIFLVFLSFGSGSIELVLKSVTGIAYPILILVFAFLGFITSIFFSSNIPARAKPESQSESAGEESGQTNRVQGEQFKNPKSGQNKNVLVDSRNIPEQLFIRGVCPHCDSVEFYIKNSGDLECKKCKSIWTGKETEFQSFRVGRNKNYRI